MAIQGTPKTRLGMYGGPRMIYGDTSGKASAAPSAGQAGSLMMMGVGMSIYGVAILIKQLLGFN